MSGAYPRARSILPTDYTRGGDGVSSATERTLPPAFENGLPRNGAVDFSLGAAANGGGNTLGYAYSPLDYSSNWQQLPKGLVDVGGDALGRAGSGGVAGGGGNQSKTYRQAVQRTMISIGLSCCFGLVTMVLRGKQSGLEFFAGYLVEQSLS